MLLAIGCAPKQEPITDSEVVMAIEGHFEALNAKNADLGLMDSYITEDFIIYEAGQIMDKEAFKAFVLSSTVLETAWELSDFRISKDERSAHASFFNRGDFIVQADSAHLRLQLEWLESAYLVRDGEALKIKFYFSDRVGMQSDTIR